MSDSSPTPQRTVVCGDAVEWLKGQDKIQGSVITSLPDFSEVPTMNINQWKDWFTMCVHEILDRLDERECAIFYQTDIKLSKHNQYVEWVDKSYLVNRGCEGTTCKLVWHKIMAFSTDISIPSVTKRKSAYSHMLCFRKDTSGHQETMPDVVSRGTMVWTKGMGFNACTMAVRYAKQIGSKCIVDPFCGKGSILAVANYMGMDSFGVELSSHKCRNATNLKISGDGEFTWDLDGSWNEEKKESRERREREKKERRERKEQEKERGALKRNERKGGKGGGSGVPIPVGTDESSSSNIAKDVEIELKEQNT